MIPLPGLGTLQLPRDVFERHLVRPVAAFDPAPTKSTELFDAAELEQRTGIPSSWWMTQARERRIPFLKLGRYVRFNLVEVMACDAYRRRALDGAGSHVQNGAASD